MAKLTFLQSEVNKLFGEDVLVVDGATRRVTHADILQKTGVPGDFDVVVIPDPVEETPDDIFE